jgi:hypothetical protein
MNRFRQPIKGKPPNARPSSLAELDSSDFQAGDFLLPCVMIPCGIGTPKDPTHRSKVCNSPVFTDSRNTKASQGKTPNSSCYQLRLQLDFYTTKASQGSDSKSKSYFNFRDLRPVTQSKGFPQESLSLPHGPQPTLTGESRISVPDRVRATRRSKRLLDLKLLNRFLGRARQFPVKPVRVIQGTT